jgi:hypothetical protein
MKKQNENQVTPAEKSAEGAPKKPYQKPELTVHGRVDEITKVLLALSHH